LQRRADWFGQSEQPSLDGYGRILRSMIVVAVELEQPALSATFIQMMRAPFTLRMIFEYPTQERCISKIPFTSPDENRE
jgi:hypothetical protein